MSSDAQIAARWRAKLKIRRDLLKRARASVVYWGQRAGSAHGREMLEEARARYALRQQQVAEAERVIARHTSVSTVSAEGIALIAGFEGFRSCPYRDVVGVWTIGYGETRGVGPNTPCVSHKQAADQLRKRVNHDYLRPVLDVADRIGLRLRQNEADALASATYNLGPGWLAAGKTMGDALRSKNRRRIGDAFLVYDKAGGQTLPGLTRRRRAERALFLR